MLNQDFLHKTKRLIVRPYLRSDYEAWHSAFSTTIKPKNRWDIAPVVKDTLTKPVFNRVLRVQKSNREKDVYYDLGAFHKVTGELVGLVSIMDINRGVFQNGYVGYRVFNSYWSQGYGKEILFSIIQIAFKKLKLHRLEAGIEPDNKRSIALIKSAGFRYEGLSKRRLFLSKSWKDMRVYALTADEVGIKTSSASFGERRF